MSGVQGQLEEFRRRLLRHFAAEERSGILERAAAFEPRFARRVERLRREHRQLRELADRLVAEAAGTGRVRIHARFVAFRRLLRDHEQAEGEVLQRAYLEDLGGSG